MKRNPVTEAKQIIQAMQLPVDAESFDRLAAVVGEVEYEFFALGLTLERIMRKLCSYGNFCIVTKRGIFTAYTLEEWEKVKS